MRTPSLSIRRHLILIAVVGSLGGCAYKPGGSQTSLDEYTYQSTTDTPKTVMLLDWTTNTTIWTMEVPVGKDLVVRFYEDFDPKNMTRPALMRWDLFPAGTGQGDLHNAIPVPDSEHRRMDWELRKNPTAVPAPESTGAPN